jgi:hypothetical protein
MIRPWREWSSPRSRRKRASTIVLATETTIPTTTPWSGGHPSQLPTPIPKATESTILSGPPRMATHFTRSRSWTENSIPIENISRMTPISAKNSKARMSETAGPGVSGLIKIPPTT